MPAQNQPVGRLIDRIKQGCQNYVLSVDTDTLLQTAEAFDNILLNERPNPENREIVDFHTYLIRAKYHVIKYFANGYYENDYEELMAYLYTAIKESTEKVYNKTRAVCEEVLLYSRALHDVTSDLITLNAGLYDADGRLVNNVELLTEVLNQFDAKLARLNDIPDNNALFGEKVKMINVKNQVVEDITSVANSIRREINILDSKEIKNFLDHSVTYLDDEEGEKSITYHPSLPDKNSVSANTIVLLSPLKDEVILFARAYANEYGKKFITFNLDKLNGKSTDFIDKFFKEITDKKLSCLIYGLTEYRGDNKATLLEKFVRFSKSGLTVFAVELKGNKNTFDEFYNVVKGAEGLSPLDVTYKYLTMPPYNDVISEFESKNMITGADYEEIKNEMLYMGYSGFNSAVMAFIQGRLWKSTAKAYSKEHEIFVNAYLKNIPSQEQFIDLGWKDLSMGTSRSKSSQPFDYDAIKSANPKNIEKILSANLTLMAKCGLIVRYCTLCGDDVSVWKNLSTEEKSKRLSDASKLVAYLLDNEYQPEVQVIPLDKWEDKGAGGLCCDGGKLIKYREDCCDSYDWTIAAICHECYHGFQHTLVNNGWKDWHWEELGVTKNRIPEWKYNFEHYEGKTSSVNYKREVVECDARTFERDCVERSSGIWNTIDLE